MTNSVKKKRFTKEQLHQAISDESTRLQECFHWLEENMSASFFEDIEYEDFILIAHNLMRLDVHDFISHVQLKTRAISLCLNTPDATLRILSHYRDYGIKHYTSFVSKTPPPFPGIQLPLRIATIFFTSYNEKARPANELLTIEQQKEILNLVKARNPQVKEEDFTHLIKGMTARFLKAMTKERLILAIDMFFRAQLRDSCQFEVRKIEEWKEKKDSPSMQIVLAWRDVPKHAFLYRLATMIARHNLTMHRSNAAYIDPYGLHNTLIMSLGLHGVHGKAAWEETNITDFLQELATLKYFTDLERIEAAFVNTGLVRGNLGNLIKSIAYFVHQVLVHLDANMYSLGNIIEGLIRHPELTINICNSFEAKFNPEKSNFQRYEELRVKVLENVDSLDTGNEINDTRRKNILRQAQHFIDYTLKTNFYRISKTGLAFRLDPAFMDYLPYDRTEKFPELPFAIFFMKGMDYIGFHIRFKDLSRGGLRTVIPPTKEKAAEELNNVFAECYNLAYTQQKKNKDIPEGGAKGIIFLNIHLSMPEEEAIYLRELEDAHIPAAEMESRLQTFRSNLRLQFLYQAQRSYIGNFLSLINCEPDGTLRAKHILDYWKKPEYIYLGPDENMHNEMIVWISNYSKDHGYKPGGSFISSKPGAGINHKEYGVTSLGVNVYMEETLKFLNIPPDRCPFMIKMSGGPDGDVAGNEMLNLSRFYPKTAKLLAITDVSGTIFDPNGLDLSLITQLFKDAKPIRFYPADKLSNGGFLLDLQTKKEQTAYAQQTLCWRKRAGALLEDWLSGNEMNALFRSNINQVKADIFVPGGGRPRTLGDHNWKDYLDESGKPTSQAIVEGANLYLTPFARRSLEKLGVLIIKDSSANKGGVICSSFEVLAGLVLSEEEFLSEKSKLMSEILEIIQTKARDEAKLLLKTHAETGAFLTDISDWISEKINTFKYQLLDHFTAITLSQDPADPLIRCLLNYCPPLLRTKYQQRILTDIPDIHKKAIIACYVASRLVYQRGLDWSPTIVEVLPLIASDPSILGDTSP